MAQVQEFYRKDIDGLRAIAILAVVAYHVGIPGVPGGFVGVDVFFVLSGYLITSLLVAEAARHGTVSLPAFYARRIRRLFPALFVVVCVTTALGALALLPVFDQQQDLSRSAIATALYVSNFYFWLHSPGYFDESASLKPLLHTWSLSVEEQFYMVWPLMVMTIVWIAQRRRMDFRRVLLFLILTILCTSLAWCIWSTWHTPTAAFYLLPSRAWELATGATLALLLPRVRHQAPRLGGMCSAIGVLAILIAVATLSEAMAFPGHLAALPVFGTALVVAGGNLSAQNPVQRFLSTRPMVLVGLLSYSWYLWHWPILALTRAYTLNEINLSRDLACGAVSLLLAYGSYRLVENPIRIGRPGPFRRTETTLAVGIMISLAMCLPAGALGAWAKFVGSRRAEFKPLIAAANDHPPLRSTCHQSPPFEGLADARKCTSGDSTRPTALVLWGDSHADHLSPLMQAFASVSPSTPVLVRSFTGCPPMKQLNVARSAQADACDQFNAAVLEEIAHLQGEGLRGVILSGRWLRSFGAPTLDAVPRQMDVVSRSGVTRPGMDSLAATVHSLTSLGLRVLVVAPIPEMRYDVPRCLARRSPNACSVERSAVDRQRAEVMRFLVDMTLREPNMRVVDFVEALCDSEECFSQKKDQILFLDDNHLTASASRSLLPRALSSLTWVSSSN